MQLINTCALRLSSKARLNPLAVFNEFWVNFESLEGVVAVLPDAAQPGERLRAQTVPKPFNYCCLWSRMSLDSANSPLTVPFGFVKLMKLWGHLLHEHENASGLSLEETIHTWLVKVIQLAVSECAVRGQVCVQPKAHLHVPCVY